MKVKWKQLIVCIIIPLLIGAVSGFLTKNSIQIFEQLNKPRLSPPGWIFPVVWTILYILMGIASYLVISLDASQAKKYQAITLYAVQLVFNFFWSIWFFQFNLYFFAFLWLLVMWGFILATTILFFQCSKLASYLMIPYILWVTFAGYLNLSIAILN
ncbi:MAG: TspO/MBR family protein [Lachnospiraceae bacterium]